MAPPDSTPTSRTLSSPNNVPWTICSILRRLSSVVGVDRDPEIIKQDAMIAIFLGINTIEVFTNIFFRVVAEEAQFVHAREQILRDLDNWQFPLHRKLQDWPQKAFEETISKNDSRWLRFIELRDWRNELTHFKSTHERVVLPDSVIITGLVDLSPYLRLNAETPVYVLDCVRGVVGAIGECRGIPTKQIHGFLHSWLGLLD